MYKVIEVNEAVATRTIELENVETGNIIECFDDSALVSFENFEFMEVGGIYDCKIKLFGRVVDTQTNQSTVCKFLKTCVVGKKKFFEVCVEEEIYYVALEKVLPNLEKNMFYFETTRKDLIEVDNIIHEDLK